MGKTPNPPKVADNVSPQAASSNGCLINQTSIITRPSVNRVA